MTGTGRRLLSRVVAVARAVERLLTTWGPLMLSVALLLAALVEMRRVEWHQVVASLPHRPLFWLTFAAFYAVPPLADWLIYRRVWGLPPAAIGALFRKAVSNDLLIGFSGEAALYGYGRRVGLGSGTVLAGLKDVTVLSAAVGNAVTLAVCSVAWPALEGLVPQLHGVVPLLLLAAFLCPPIVAVSLFRHRVLRLDTADILAVATVHAGRAALTVGLTALLWHLALPSVGVRAWIMLSAVKLIVSRLPLVSNKEIVFVSVALLLLGPAVPIVSLVTLIATAVTATHVALALAFVTGGEWRRLFREPWSLMKAA